MDYHPSETELYNSAKRFMFICMRAFLNALKKRKTEIFIASGAVPLGLAPGIIENADICGLSRDQILEFFEGCNSLMMMPETKQALKNEASSIGGPPNSKVKDLVGDMNHAVGDRISKEHS